MPGAMEATEGVAPELVTHSEDALSGSRDEMSPEEQAVHAPGSNGAGEDETADADRKDYADEETDTAALAEGRAEPPADAREETV
jgi:hypothetical protein